MAYKATLKFDGKDPGLDVLSCSYGFNRSYDHKGRPSSDTSGGTISLSLESTKDTSILKSMLAAQDKGQAVTIEFQENDSTQVMKKITLTQAYVVDFQESFSDGAPMMYNVTLSAREIEIGDAKLVNDWPTK